MKEKYMIGIDQSTQGTKALLFNQEGKLIARKDLSHKQILNEKGWVSHEPEEIYKNTIQVVKGVIEESKIDKSKVLGIGISNQRETTVVWDRTTGKPLEAAIVWQCARATDICQKKEIKEQAEVIKRKTGMQIAPYFPAAKIAWILENNKQAKELSEKGQICHGTIDTWLVYKLTNGASYYTDYSNASRTQLFDIHTLEWDTEICSLFGIKKSNLPTVIDSNAKYGETTLNGFLDEPIPIQCVMGDSHAALFGQACFKTGMLKATYGTGSSIMMNIGTEPMESRNGLSTSLAWSRDGIQNYVIEGNLNYTGAIISWLLNDLQLIQSPNETEELSNCARKNDSLYMVPAFTGLGAPYWDSHAKAAIVGMDRTTTKNEFVRASIECIAYQIWDIIEAMQEDAKVDIKEIRVDGGPTKNSYLMQFQSDLMEGRVCVSQAEELSGIGAAYMAGLTIGMWEEGIFKNIQYNEYQGNMDKQVRNEKLKGWKKAVYGVIEKSEKEIGRDYKNKQN